MQKGEYSLSSSRSSTRSFFGPSTLDHQPTLRVNLSNKQGTTIAIFVEASLERENPNEEPFLYAFKILEKTTCRVVVVSSLSKVASPLGVFLVEDTSNTALKETAALLLSRMNVFLEKFRLELYARGVQLDIVVKVGPKSVDVVVDAANELHPHWVILDRSFSPHEWTLAQNLDNKCNLVLIRKPPADAKVIRWDLGPTKTVRTDEPSTGEREPDHINLRRGDPPDSPQWRASSSQGQRSGQWTRGGSSVRSTVFLARTESTITNTTTTTSTVGRSIFNCFCCADPAPSYLGPSRSTRTTRRTYAFLRSSNVRLIEARLEAQMAKTPSEYDGDEEFRQQL